MDVSKKDMSSSGASLCPIKKHCNTKIYLTIFHNTKLNILYLVLPNMQPQFLHIIFVQKVVRA